MARKIRFAIFASGQGSNAMALIDQLQAHSEQGELAFVLSDRAQAPVLAKTQARGLRSYLIEAQGSKKDQETQILRLLAEHQVDWILLAGYMRLLSASFIERFSSWHGGQEQIINIHPSLLPAYPGKDSLQRAFAEGCEFSGVTLHQVDAGMDTGRILVQEPVPRKSQDALEDFVQRAHHTEHRLYRRFVQEICEGHRPTAFFSKGDLMFKQRLAIRSRYDHSLDQALKKRLPKEFSGSVKVHRLFWVQEKVAGFLSEQNPEQVFQKVFYDPISEEIQFESQAWNTHSTYSEIRFLPGVTDNLARTATEALALLLPASVSSWQDYPVEVHSGWQVEVEGDINKEKLQGILQAFLGNPLLYKTEIARGDEVKSLKQWQNFENHWQVKNRELPTLPLLPLNVAELDRVNRERGLSLSLSEIETIVQYFSQESVQESRRHFGWQNMITDVELECLAQTWSEHCKHKIFAAQISYSQESVSAAPTFSPETVNSLYKTFIQGATKQLKDRTDLVSVFKDNAGIVNWDQNVDVCIKVETHNSPSALDPFGGALTGILGVNRDILGCGLGAKPIANTDVFCLSHKDLFPEENSPQRPLLLKEPSQILTGVHQGVEEGGNQSGIPTVNGAFYFASEFAAKPLIFVGSLGVMPKQVHGRATSEKRIKAGDKVIVAGGRLGKDGVHGATFSSAELQDNISSQVVQIGDPITQKRLIDFTLQARDRGWIEAITDNGAGGISSSIGEMASLVGGARIDLALHPVKYSGLEFYEMLVSESQERMSYAVSSENMPAFLKLAQDMGVEAFCLGEFTGSGFLEVYHHDKAVAHLPLEFMHEGLEKMKLKAHWLGPQTYQPYFRKTPAEKISSMDMNAVKKALPRILASPNVASKEEYVRYYDQEVQGATRVKPFVGVHQHGPMDAAVLDMGMHGGEQGRGLAVSCGLAPQYSYYDTYLMAQKSCDEALRNLICVGVDPDRVALVDNFCWPDPVQDSLTRSASAGANKDAEHKLAQLYRAAKGIYDAAADLGAPFVSGKDSMKNDFNGKIASGEKVKISVPPTLLITAMGHVPATNKIVTSCFQKAGDKIYLLGQKTKSLLGSEFANHFAFQDATTPEYPDLKKNKKLYHKIFSAIQQGLLQSCHDISDGGLLVSLLESAFGNEKGFAANLQNWSFQEIWSETGSQFVVSVDPAKEKEFQALFAGDTELLGTVSADEQMQLTYSNETWNCTLKEMQTLWQEGFSHVI